MLKLSIKFHKLICTAGDQQMKSTARRDKLISVQQRARDIWERYQYFTVQPNQKPKFFQTFPFPYMNGTLHLGHAFSMTKCDFNAWYKRLKGFNILFPFGYHCTGMPISAAAKKLGFQLQTYGNPPNLPVSITKYQYEIMQQLGIPQEDIAKFSDPYHWVKHFPPIGRQHIKRFGVHVDHSRSFITTDLNPYYDTFIRWQFTLLKQRGYIKYGKRPSIYSPKDKQMCADHDRSEGQGIGPQQYTIIKIKVLQFNQRLNKSLQGRNVFLAAATLRPETMYGQTSCCLLPTGDYVAVQMKNNQVFICSERSAQNMAYQNLTRQHEKVQIIDTFKGEELMGLPISAPNAVHKRIYILPMMTISMKKTTGVVTCVPSDAPDDWMVTCDLRNKKNLRQKYNITQEMVNIEPVPLINTPTYGDLTAVKLCQIFKIKSQNDKQLLEKAKEEAYKKGFHEGTMIIGNFKGAKVSEAKPLVKKQLIQRGQALVYYEPGGHVVSRSGDVCVVSYCDQWYLNYADEKWKKRVLNHVTNNFKTNNETLHNDLIYTIEWLKEWGCSRSFGLGTKLPFDQQYLIESLSDSTIYFAYYTISHFLQGNIEGSKPGMFGIKPQDITHDFWSYILLGEKYTSNKVPQYKLDRMRQSFLYWYPMDLRCSAKDLIKNHLTMALFNHAAIWEDDKFWPRGYYCNGYINVEGAKMSKSVGNFISLEDAMNQYGSDSARMACAQAGDSINDANFTKQNGNAAIMQLSTLQMFFVKALENRTEYRVGISQKAEVNYYDNIFQNSIEDQINKVGQAYEKMIYRDVIKYGLHDFTSIKDEYILNCDAHKPRLDLIQRYIYLQLLFLYSICPHFCQVSYIDYFLTFSSQPKEYPELLGHCKFPIPAIQINHSIIKANKYFHKFMILARDNYTKVTKPRKGEIPKVTKGLIIYRSKFQDYQLQVLKILRSLVVNNTIPADWRNELKIDNKDCKTKMLKFGGFIEKEYKVTGSQALEQSLIFDELKTLNIFISSIKKEFPFELQIVQVGNAPARENKSWKETLGDITPGNPIIVFQ